MQKSCTCVSYCERATCCCRTAPRCRCMASTMRQGVCGKELIKVPQKTCYTNAMPHPEDMLRLCLVMRDSTLLLPDSSQVLASMCSQ